MRSRLATVAEDIDQAIARANPSAALRSGAIAASFALDQVGLSDLSSTGGADLDKLVVALDEEYLSAQGKVETGHGNSGEVLAAFSKARAASALAYANRGEPAEAFYEAIAATDDASQLRSLVMGVLDGAA